MIDRTSSEERMKVHRVRVQSPDEPTEIVPCWISVHPAQQLVKIWLAREESSPARVAPLLGVVIEWEASETDA